MVKKIVIFSLIAILALSCLYSVCAGVFDDHTEKMMDVTTEAEDAVKVTKNVLGGAIDVVQWFCVGFAVIVLIVHGIRYMSAAPEGKAEIKRELTFFLIGAGIIFMASTLVEILQTLFKTAVEESQGGA